MDKVKCPNCGNEDSLLVEAKCVVEWHPDEGVIEEGAADWEMDTLARCPKCQHIGKFWQFGYVKSLPHSVSERLYQREFGASYDLGINLPDHWEDHSYHNDVAPQFIYRIDDIRFDKHYSIRMWVAPENPDHREHLPARYTYTLVSDRHGDGDWVHVVDLKSTNCRGKAQCVADSPLTYLETAICRRMGWKSGQINY